MTTFTHTGCSAPNTPANKPSLLLMIRLGIAARRQRAALRKLDDAQLSDLGLTRTQRDIEAARPVWDVPHNWLR